MKNHASQSEFRHDPAKNHEKSETYFFCPQLSADIFFVGDILQWDFAKNCKGNMGICVLVRSARKKSTEQYLNTNGPIYEKSCFPK